MFEAKITITSLRCLSVSVNLEAFADILTNAGEQLLTLFFFLNMSNSDYKVSIQLLGVG